MATAKTRSRKTLALAAAGLSSRCWVRPGSPGVKGCGRPAVSGTAYAARVGCSCRFVAGASRRLRQGQACGDGADFAERRRAAKSVTASIPLIASDTAAIAKAMAASSTSGAIRPRRVRSNRSSHRRSRARRHRLPRPGPAQRQIPDRRNAASPPRHRPARLPASRAFGLARLRTLAVSGTSGIGPIRLVSMIRAAVTASRRLGPTFTCPASASMPRRIAVRAGRRCRVRDAGRRCNGSRPCARPAVSPVAAWTIAPGAHLRDASCARSWRSRHRGRSRYPGCRASLHCAIRRFRQLADFGLGIPPSGKRRKASCCSVVA